MGEYFGALPQQALERRAHDLWRIVRDDKRFCCHGRAVALSDHETGTVELQAAIAQLQGVCPLNGIPVDVCEARIRDLETSGLETDTYVNWQGGLHSIALARDIVSQGTLPEDLTIETIGPTTTNEVLMAMDALANSCDVLLPMDAFLRGIEKPGVVIAALDPHGQAVGLAAGITQNHSDHPKAGTAY